MSLQWRIDLIIRGSVGDTFNVAYVMRDELGLSARTIAGRCWQARHLLDSLEAAKRSLARLSLKEVDDYLAMKADHGWGRVSMASAASALRSFFKYAEMRRWCPAGIAGGIEGPRVFRDEGLPRGLDWQWVRQLIASTSGCSARDIHDRAILMLFAIYGLRRGEVSQLRLEDVDWEHEVLRVHRPNSGVRRTIRWYQWWVTLSCAIFRRSGLALPAGSFFWHSRLRSVHCRRTTCTGL